MASGRERVEFVGSRGERLVGTIDLPAGPVRATAVFAHCFTCSSETAATARISTALAEVGIAVMRFDFTGLGRSEGEFADTNFSTNIDDIVAASEYLSERFAAPGLLVGHSLGGAAVLAAAPRLHSVRAVVTIGAPSSPSHVEGLLSTGAEALAADGEATVDIGGRPFLIRQQLLDDLRANPLKECLQDLDAALLVMHSPVDNIVGIANAAEIFQMARHPKSFVSLDGATHLLTDRRDAAFAAAMIRTWAERYLDEPANDVDEQSPIGVLVAETGLGRYTQQVIAGRHRFLMDEPASAGGDDAGPNPYEMLAAALGACTSMTMRMYAERKGIPLESAEVEVRHGMTHAHAGEAAASDQATKTDRWDRFITLRGQLTDEQRKALLRIADRCPVHRTLERASVVVTSMADSAQPSE